MFHNTFRTCASLHCSRGKCFGCLKTLKPQEIKRERFKRRDWDELTLQQYTTLLGNKKQNFWQHSMKNSAEGFQSTRHAVTLTVWRLVWWSELKPSLESSKELKLIPGSRALQRTLGNTSISSTQVAQTYTQTHTHCLDQISHVAPPHTTHLHSGNDIICTWQPQNLSNTFTLLPFSPPVQAFRGPETAV